MNSGDGIRVHYFDETPNDPASEAAALALVGVVNERKLNPVQSLEALTLALSALFQNIDWSTMEMLPGRVLDHMAADVLRGMALEMEYRQAGHG